jgi:hypothetical protein
VLDCELFPQVAEFHLSFRLRCDQRDLVFSEDLVKKAVKKVAWKVVRKEL